MGYPAEVGGDVEAPVWPAAVGGAARVICILVSLWMNESYELNNRRYLLKLASIPK